MSITAHIQHPRLVRLALAMSAFLTLYLPALAPAAINGHS